MEKALSMKKEGMSCGVAGQVDAHPWKRSKTPKRFHCVAAPSLPRSQRFKHFLCSLPVVVTAVYFAILLVTAVVITTTTHFQITRSLMQSWAETHATQIAIVEASITNVAITAHRMTENAAALYLQFPTSVESPRTLSMLCAELDMGDVTFNLRLLALGAFDVQQYASCMHADRTNPFLSNLTAIQTLNERFYGVYYVNPDTYTYYDPPKAKAIVDPNWPIELLISNFRATNPLFSKVDAFLNGSGEPIQASDLWDTPTSQPYSIYYTMPVFLLGDSLPSQPFIHPSDFAQTRIDGATILNKTLFTKLSPLTSAMILINQSLSDDDPKVLSNDWGQETVHSPAFTLVVPANTTYLTISQISDPLMREAVQQINFRSLQNKHYKVTQLFEYRGAPAAITAWVYNSPLGLTLPMVVVSSQHDLLGPYILKARLCIGMVAVAVVLMTGLCYLAMDRYLARPLRRLTTAMLASLRRGVRQPVRADPCDVVQLTETRELTQAYNAAMAQLRLVDEFVQADTEDPASTTATATSTRTATPKRPLRRLQQQYLTIVTVRIRSSAAAGQSGVDTTTILQQHAHDARRERFAAFVDAVAVANTQMTSSGPFASPAALAAFVCAVRELCAAHHGTVHRLTPDSCVLHFASAVRTCMARQQRHPPPPPDIAESVEGDGATNAAFAADAGASADVEACATADARAAVDFALALQQWVEEQRAAAAETGEHGGEDGGATPAGPPSAAAAAAAAVPDVRVLVDTGVFTCGQYRADALEQTLSVALGRDAERAVGGVAAQIGVRVALTEETAVRVRGVRQIPVEALHTGRAGLDADVIILYEALPGPVAGDAAWQQYARCCFDGFAAMVDGDYAGALRCYRSVAEIAELEPGLLPRCVSREAAASSVVGGAVSTQVARLIAECEVRVVRRCTEGFARRRVVPFGVDALLPGEGLRAAPRKRRVSQAESVSAAAEAAAAASADASETAIVGGPAGAASRRPFLRGVAAPVPMGSGVSPWRYVVSVNTFHGAVRRVLGGRPDWIRDNYGLYWYLPRRRDEAGAAASWREPCTALGSSGVLCTVRCYLLRDVHAGFARRVEAAPVGPMSDELRSAVPVTTVSAATRSKVQLLSNMLMAERHPNLMRPVAYSFGVEGCLTVMWEFCPGGTLRDVVARYPYLKPVAMYRLGYGILSALAHLHARGLVHGSLSLDTVSVAADGGCRLVDRYTDIAIDNDLFVAPCPCYVSPAMAAGNMPTPACDMFCYGLLCVEALSRQPAWAWAAAVQRGDDELRALMAEGGVAFRAAVADGAVVPNVAALDSEAVVQRYSRLERETVRGLLSYDASTRLSAALTLEVTRVALIRCELAEFDQSSSGSSCSC